MVIRKNVVFSIQGMTVSTAVVSGSWFSVSTFYLHCNTEWHRCGHHCVSYLDIDTESKTKDLRISD